MNISQWIVFSGLLFFVSFLIYLILITFMDRLLLAVAVSILSVALMIFGIPFLAIFPAIIKSCEAVRRKYLSGWRTTLCTICTPVPLILVLAFVEVNSSLVSAHIISIIAGSIMLVPLAVHLISALFLFVVRPSRTGFLTNKIKSWWQNPAIYNLKKSLVPAWLCCCTVAGMLFSYIGALILRLFLYHFEQFSK